MYSVYRITQFCIVLQRTHDEKQRGIHAFLPPVRPKSNVQLFSVLFIGQTFLIFPACREVSIFHPPKPVIVGQRYQGVRRKEADDQHRDANVHEGLEEFAEGRRHSWNSRAIAMMG